MTTLLTTDLIARCHEGSKAKGFWDEAPHPGQQNMLIISELSEALEAHRKGRTKPPLAPNHVAHMIAEMANPDDASRKFFENEIKDSVGDELADAYIRLCDYAGGYEVSPQAIIAHKNYWAHPDRIGWTEPMQGVFGADLIQVVIAVVEIDSRIGSGAIQRHLA